MTTGTMKRYLLQTFLLVVACLACHAQKETSAVTAYKDFRPATVYMTNGKKVKVAMANIFLKNSSLLFMKGEHAIEVTMKTINRVDFSDRSYFRLDTLLAYRVDTVADNALYCAELLDIKTFRDRIQNNQKYSSLDLGEVFGYTTVDLGEENSFPVNELYFFRVNGKTVLAHERTLKRALNKEQRNMMASIMSYEEFKWTDPQWLKRLLKAITIK